MSCVFESRKNCKKKAPERCFFLAVETRLARIKGDGITEKGEFIRQSKC